MVKVFWLDGQTRVYTLTAAPADGASLRLRRRPARHGRDRLAYTVLGVEHILTRLRPSDVRARAAVPRRLQPAAACSTITAFTLAHSLTLALQRARLAHAAFAAGRSDDRALDRARRRRSAARASRRFRAAGPRVVAFLVRARARPRLRRRAEGDRPAAEPSCRGAADVQSRRRARPAAGGRRRVPALPGACALAQIRSRTRSPRCMRSAPSPPTGRSAASSQFWLSSG